MDIVVRPIRADEVDAFRERLAHGFGEDPADDPARFRRLVPLERTECAFDGDTLVGTCAAFPLSVSVPGGEVRMAGTTMVTVAATHRRQGVLRAMITEHLTKARSLGEPLAGLWASESGIYGRFGYGEAARALVIGLDVARVRFTDPTPRGRVRVVDAAAALEHMPGIHDAVRRSRAGMPSRDPTWWADRIVHDPPHERDGRTAQRYALYEVDGAVTGYAVFSQKQRWDAFPEGEVFVVELMAVDPDAHSGLWRFLAAIDLFPNVRYFLAAEDDELWRRVDDGRRVSRALWDSLWLRVLDVPAALEARRYEQDGTLRLAVDDSLFPDAGGRFDLTVRDGAGTCRRGTGEAEVRLDTSALASLYLGGASMGPLARTGAVHGTDEALGRAGRLLRCADAPWCPEIF